MDSAEFAIWSREVAALIAQGHAPDRIAERHDLDPNEIEEILDSEEFTTALTEYGPEVVEAWAETRAAKKTISFRRRIAENLDLYAQELDKLAMSGQLKPEKRADILLALLKAGSGPDDVRVQRVEMPPQLLENWARRTREFDEHKEEFEFGVKTHGNPDPTESTAREEDKERK